MMATTASCTNAAKAVQPPVNASAIRSPKETPVGVSVATSRREMSTVQ